MCVEQSTIAPVGRVLLAATAPAMAAELQRPRLGAAGAESWAVHERAHGARVLHHRCTPHLGRSLLTAQITEHRT